MPAINACAGLAIDDSWRKSVALDHQPRPAVRQRRFDSFLRPLRMNGNIVAPASSDAKTETIASVDFGSTRAMRSCFSTPCSTNRTASDTACSNNSRKVVTRSSSIMADASGVAAAVRRSQSESRLLSGASRSGSGKRHPPGEADPCGSE